MSDPRTGWRRVLVVPVLFVLAACSGNASEPAPSAVATLAPTEIGLGSPATGTPGPAPEVRPSLEEALEALTVDDLPGLMLSKTQLGGLAVSTLVATRTGPTSNVEVTRRFPALDLGVADLEAWGREGGYLVAYDNWTLGTYQGGPAAFEVGIELFDSDQGASEYVKARWREMSLSDPEPGIAIESAEAFEVSREGGGGLAVVGSRDGYERRVGVTMAAIQRGRLVSWVSVIEFDPYDRTGYASRTATIFDDLIEDILNGDREPGDMPVAQRLGPEFKAERPKGGQDLEFLAIDESDVPGAFQLAWSGYVNVAGYPYAYTRSFADEPFANLTSLPLSSIQLQLVPLSDPKLYGAVLDELRTIPEDEYAAQLEATVGLRDISIERAPLPYGDDALIVMIEGDEPLLGSSEYGLIWVARGDVALLVIASGPKGLLTQSDILEIAEAAAAHFTSATPE